MHEHIKKNKNKEWKEIREVRRDMVEYKETKSIDECWMRGWKRTTEDEPKNEYASRAR